MKSPAIADKDSLADNAASLAVDPEFLGNPEPGQTGVGNQAKVVATAGVDHRSAAETVSLHRLSTLLENSFTLNTGHFEGACQVCVLPSRVHKLSSNANGHQNVACNAWLLFGFSGCGGMQNYDLQIMSLTGNARR